MPNYDSTNKAVLQVFLSIKKRKKRLKLLSDRKKRLIIVKRYAMIIRKIADFACFHVFAQYFNYKTEVATLDALKIVASVLLLIASIMIIVLVLMQNSKQSGLSALNASADSYFSKNKSRTLSAKIVSLTRIFVIVFFVLTIALNLFVAHLK